MNENKKTKRDLGKIALAAAKIIFTAIIGGVITLAVQLILTKINNPDLPLLETKEVLHYIDGNQNFSAPELKKFTLPDNYAWCVYQTANGEYAYALDNETIIITSSAKFGKDYQSLNFSELERITEKSKNTSGNNSSTSLPSASVEQEIVPIHEMDWMDVCPPVYNSSYENEIYNGIGDGFLVFGNKYDKGIVLSTNSYILFNLNNKFSKVIFTVGYNDGGISYETIEIEVTTDTGVQQVFEVELTKSPREIEVPLNYAGSMKISYNTFALSKVGLINGKFYE